MTTAEVLFNPFDPAFRADPYPFYDRLRVEAPVYTTPFGDHVLSRYSDVSATLRNNDFSRDLDANSRQDPASPRAQRLERQAEAKTILNLDPPDHTRLRRLVSKAFTPSAIERLRPRVQQLVGDVLDRAAARGTMELVDELAFPVPFQVISDLLAMPTERSAELRDWSQALTATLEPTATAEELDRGLEARDAVAAYLTEVIEARRANLGDDVLSALIVLEEDGDRLSHLELISFVLLLYVAGHETTVNLIGNGTLALLRNREQLALWRDDPSLGAAAVDELLRFDGPVQLTARTPLVDVTFSGAHGEPVVLDAHSTVFCVLGAANHDPDAFDDPHRLDLRRPNAGRHLAFSAGIHYCLGAALARLEAEEAIGMLIRRFPTIEMNAEPAWRDRLTIRGVSRLDLTVA